MEVLHENEETDKDKWTRYIRLHCQATPTNLEIKKVSNYTVLSFNSNSLGISDTSIRFGKIQDGYMQSPNKCTVTTWFNIQNLEDEEDEYLDDKDL